ncbi:MAG: helix-turn-helix transcriptional regulator [Asticcacaulis sp.]|uniref:helix-turn-helix domain-containing protein n=1 Tax=Asticcacaulis sp. TaxID=1872648 RepID=UPI0039E64438
MRIRRVVRPTAGACIVKNDRNPVDIRLGELMKQRRKHLGLTKTGLAAQLALTKDDIRKYERGDVPFRADMLAVLPIALKVRVPFFTDPISGMVRKGGVVRP